MSETLWQKAYDEYVHDNSYQGKLEKENARLKAKLEKLEQIIKQVESLHPEVAIGDREGIRKIKEILEKE